MKFFKKKISSIKRSYRIIIYDHSYWKYMVQISDHKFLWIWNYNWKDSDKFEDLKSAEISMVKQAAARLEEMKQPLPGTVIKKIIGYSEVDLAADKLKGTIK